MHLGNAKGHGMQSVDCVIVGADSAGCVLVNRLTAGGDFKVLLLEAGGPNDALAVHDPAAGRSTFSTARDWTYMSLHQACQCISH